MLSVRALPTDTLGLIESYLAPSDCAHLSASCVSFKQRWTATRWRLTFQLHYGTGRRRGRLSAGASGVRRTVSFVGCCCEQCCTLPSSSSSASSSSSSSQPSSSSSSSSSTKTNNGSGDSNASTAAARVRPKECHGGMDSNLMMMMEEEKTQFNVSALIPSLRKAYSSLWDTIELAMLGYYDSRYNFYAAAAAAQQQQQQQMVPAAASGADGGSPHNVALSDFMDYMLFLIGLKPLLRRRERRKRARRAAAAKKCEDSGNGSNSSNRRKFDPLLALRSSTTSMSAWKLACILKERGVDCIRCSICNQIDLGGSSVPHNSWLRPCNCPELVHRGCLERRLGMITKLRLTNRNDRMWISFDDTFHNNNNNAANANLQQQPQVQLQQQQHHTTTATANNFIVGNAAVNEQNELTSFNAHCDTCNTRYCRSVRLPCNKSEVVLASMSDPLSRLRALSTLIHFVLCCLFIGATEGMCHERNVDNGDHDDHAYCLPRGGGYYTLLERRSSSNHQHHFPLFVLKWPKRGGFALAWWQLQQCCMLHIFFSPRFAAIVDRLWMGPIRYFYCKMYLYFVFTSALLALSYLPFVSRAAYQQLASSVWGPICLGYLTPLFEVLALLNLAQYAVVSTMVICIFWRTNIRVFTVADRREEAAWEWETRRNSHPVYHGQWQ